MNTRSWPSLRIGSFDGRARAKAAGIHLGASVGVAALAAALVFTLWFPWPYSIISGGTELFTLLVSVDVALGPLITFAIFDRRKPMPELRRDLAVIVVLQLAALGYGLHTTYVARPVVLALEGDRFRAVSALEVVESELPAAPPRLRALPLDGPRIVRTAQPTEGNEKYDAIQLALAGIDLGMRPKFWRSWDEAAMHEALAKAKPLKPLIDRQSRHDPQLDSALSRTGHELQSLAYLPLLARRSDWVVLLDARSGAVVGFAPLDGF